MLEKEGGCETSVKGRAMEPLSYNRSWHPKGRAEPPVAGTEVTQRPACAARAQPRKDGLFEIADA